MRLNSSAAARKRSHYHFTPTTLASLDFGRLQPVMCVDSILDDHWTSFKGKGMVRVEPQVFPPFGRLNLRHATFFVPDWQIVQTATAFHENKTTFKGSATSMPTIANYWLNSFLSQPKYCSLVKSNCSIAELTSDIRESEPTLDYDFTYQTTTTTWPVDRGMSGNAAYKLTPLGWKVYGVFKALGYDFCTFGAPLDTDTNLVTYRQRHLHFVSAIPLMAYLHIYSDYFLSGVDYNTSPVSALCEAVYSRHDFSIGNVKLFTGSTMQFELNTEVFNLLANISLMFEQNMYTTAWNSTNSPNGVTPDMQQIGGSSNSLISPVTSNGTYEDSSFKSANRFGNAGTIVAHQSGVYHSNRLSTGETAGLNSFSAKGHEWLMRVMKYVDRHNLSGSRPVQNLLSRFGVTPSDKEVQMCFQIEKGSSRIMFNAVTSQSDTFNGSQSNPLGKNLGDFAGFGLGGLDIDFNYKANTFGTIITLAWLSIDPIIEHGNTPYVLRTQPLDFYNPEFDGAGYRPIPTCEVQGAYFNKTSGVTPKSIYGYTNLYDDYRQMRDIVCGAFSDKTTRHFAFMRDLSYAVSEGNGHPQNAVVKYYNPFVASRDMTNPFLTNANKEDRFWFNVEWDINVTRKVLSSEDSLGLGEGDVQFAKNGDLYNV